MQQIAYRLEAARGAPTTEQTETLGALEALREMLLTDKTVGVLLPSDTWGRVYAYVVTVGTHNVEALVRAHQPGGPGDDGASRTGAGGQALQQAALAVLLEGTESFMCFIDRDIAADYAAFAAHPLKEDSLVSGKSCSSSPQKGNERWTLLERLLALTASPHLGVAYNAGRALSRIVGALCAATGGGASGNKEAYGGTKQQAETAATPGAADSSKSTLPLGGLSRECALAVRGFAARVIADLRRDSLLQQTLQASQPEGWWQQCGCRGIVAHRCLPLFPAKERSLQGLTAATACLRLAAAGCGSAWQQLHGPSCTKHALHLLAAAGAVAYSLVEGAKSHGVSIGTPMRLPNETRDLKKRRLSALAQQDPSAHSEEDAGRAPSLHHSSDQEQRVPPRAEDAGGGGELLLPASLCTQLQRVSLTLFRLHAKAGALPGSLVPKAAAAIGRAARALLRGAVAEEVAAAPPASGAVEATSSLGPQEATEAEAAGSADGAAADTEEANGEDGENLSHGGRAAAASAMRRLVQESLLLALTEDAVQPPIFVSVAFLWKQILGGEGQGDFLAGDLSDGAYRPAPRLSPPDSSKSSSSSSGREKRPRELSWETQQRLTNARGDAGGEDAVASVSSWQVLLSELLLEQFFSLLAGGVKPQSPLQGGAVSGLGAVAQRVFESIGDEEDETAATEALMQLGGASLAVFPASVPSNPSLVLPAALSVAGTSPGSPQGQTKEEETAVIEGLVDFAVSLEGGRSQQQLLCRVAGCFCHLFSDPAMRRRFLKAPWCST